MSDGTGIFIGNPKYVGCYILSGNWSFYFQKKPSWLHRKMTKLLLGWEWKDA